MLNVAATALTPGLYVFHFVQCSGISGTDTISAQVTKTPLRKKTNNKLKGSSLILYVYLSSLEKQSVPNQEDQPPLDSRTLQPPLFLFDVTGKGN